MTFARRRYRRDNYCYLLGEGGDAALVDPGDAEAAAKGEKELGRFLPVIEQRLEGREWLAGDFSIADIAYAPHLWLSSGGGLDLSPWPRLRGWLDRMLARPAWVATEKMIFSGAA